MSRKLLLFITLALLLSFATLNAVLFTPALSELAAIFRVSVTSIESTFIWFLAGYCFGQLLYGSLDNRFGRKPTLFFGIGLQLLSSLMALYAGYFSHFNLLIVSRFFLALGSGVGLMMAFTIVSEQYEKEHVQRIISYLLPAFAIVPALGIVLSGYFTQIYGWSANFYLAIIYGLMMLILCSLLPSSPRQKDNNALCVKKILTTLQDQLHNKSLVISGILMGICVAFVYIFSTLVPFITSTYFHFTSVDYGLANAFSAVGLLVGSIIGAILPKTLSNQKVIGLGASINIIGSLGILLGEYVSLPAFISFFIPLFLINLGSCFVLSHASARVLDEARDKSNASAAMSFINVGTTTLVMLLFSFLPLGHYLLACTFIALSVFMLVLVCLMRCCKW
jgi:MFS family permease